MVSYIAYRSGSDIIYSAQPTPTTVLSKAPPPLAMIRYPRPSGFATQRWHPPPPMNDGGVHSLAPASTATPTVNGDDNTILRRPAPTHTQIISPTGPVNDGSIRIHWATSTPTPTVDGNDNTVLGRPRPTHTWVEAPAGPVNDGDIRIHWATSTSTVTTNVNEAGHTLVVRAMQIKHRSTESSESKEIDAAQASPSNGNDDRLPETDLPPVVLQPRAVDNPIPTGHGPVMSVTLPSPTVEVYPRPTFYNDTATLVLNRTTTTRSTLEPSASPILMPEELWLEPGKSTIHADIGRIHPDLVEDNHMKWAGGCERWWSHDRVTGKEIVVTRCPPNWRGQLPQDGDGESSGQLMARRNLLSGSGASTMPSCAPHPTPTLMPVATTHKFPAADVARYSSGIIFGAFGLILLLFLLAAAAMKCHTRRSLQQGRRQKNKKDNIDRNDVERGGIQMDEKADATPPRTTISNNPASWLQGRELPDQYEVPDWRRRPIETARARAEARNMHDAVRIGEMPALLDRAPTYWGL